MDISHKVDLDISYSKLLNLVHGTQDHVPHVLLVSSQLKQFSRVSQFVQNVVSVF